MCVNGIRVIYVCFIIIVIVTAHDTKDDHKYDPKPSRRHPKIKAAVKDSEIIKIPMKNNVLESSTKHSVVIEDDSEEFISQDKLSPKESIDLNKLSEDDVSRTGFVDGKNIETLSDQIVDHNDAEALIDFDTANAKIEHDSEDDQDLTDDGGEAFVYAPTIKAQAEDVIVDVKARTGELSEPGRSGYVPQEDNDSAAAPVLREKIKTAFFQEDYSDAASNPHDYRSEYLRPFNKLNGITNDLLPLSYAPNKETTRPRITYDRPHPILRFSNVFFNKINSGEMVYPKPNNHEIAWGQGNAPGQLINSMPVYPYSSSEGCSACHKKIDRSLEDFGSSAKQFFHTDNGRSIEFEPFDANSYPYVVQHDNGQPRTAPRLLDVPSEEFTSRELKSQAIGLQKMQSINPFNQEVDQFPKIINPYGFQRASPIIMNRRLELGGYFAG